MFRLIHKQLQQRLRQLLLPDVMLRYLGYRDDVLDAGLSHRPNRIKNELEKKWQKSLAEEDVRDDVPNGREAVDGLLPDDKLRVLAH